MTLHKPLNISSFMQILKSPFNWKNVSFHTHSCLTFDHGKVSDEIMRSFGRPTDRTGQKKSLTLHTEMLWRTEHLFSSAISAGLIWGPSLPTESKNTSGRGKAHHRNGEEVDSLGQDTALTQPETPSKPSNVSAPAESCPNFQPETQNSRPLPETSVKQTLYFLST